jgi:hypothetical protein
VSFSVVASLDVVAEMNDVRTSYFARDRIDGTDGTTNAVVVREDDEMNVTIEKINSTK